MGCHINNRPGCPLSYYLCILCIKSMYINVCATHGTSAYEIRSGLCIFKLPGVGLSHAAWDSLWALADGLWVQALLPVAHRGRPARPWGLVPTQR